MIEDCDRLNMRQKKGDSTTHLLSKRGKFNFDQIKKSCGCVLGRCSCKANKGKRLGKLRFTRKDVIDIPDTIENFLKIISFVHVETEKDVNMLVEYRIGTSPLFDILKEERVPLYGAESQDGKIKLIRI